MERGFIAKELEKNYPGVRSYNVTPLVRMREPLAERIALRKGGRSSEETE
jgi:hypothetical protein